MCANTTVVKPCEIPKLTNNKNNIPYDPEQFKETDHDELHAQVHGD